MTGSIFVKVQGRDVAPREYSFHNGGMDMGRDPGCGIVIQGKDVSRRHASLAKSGGEFILKDLGSSSGTWVEGRRLNGPWVLRSGTTVYLGSVAVTFDFESHEQTILVGGPRGDAGERITVRADASRRGPLPVEGLEDRMAVRLAMLYDLPLQFASTHNLASLSEQPNSAESVGEFLAKAAQQTAAKVPGGKAPAWRGKERGEHPAI